MTTGDEVMNGSGYDLAIVLDVIVKNCNVKSKVEPTTKKGDALRRLNTLPRVHEKKLGFASESSAMSAPSTNHHRDCRIESIFVTQGTYPQT
eukprot:scaffold92543_cov35-Tisochrysis_lutea.AAC.2